MQVGNITQNNIIAAAQTRKIQEHDRDFKAELTAAMSDKDQQKLRTVCQDFEALLLNMMLQSMRATVPKSDLFGHDTGKEIFEDMLDQEISQSMSKAGGVGLADMLYKQLLNEQRNNKPGTA